jgi:hypothetical protein
VSKHIALPAYNKLDDATSDNSPVSERRLHARSFRLLAVITVTATAALANGYTITSTTALGVSSVIFTATGLVLFESALQSSKDDNDKERGLMSANGTFSRRTSPQGAQREQLLASLRDVAMVVALVCGMATYFVEPAITPHAISWEPVYRQLPGDWKTLHYHRTVQQCLLMILVNLLVNTLLFFMVRLHPFSFCYTL